MINVHLNHSIETQAIEGKDGFGVGVGGSGLGAWGGHTPTHTHGGETKGH